MNDGNSGYTVEEANMVRNQSLSEVDAVDLLAEWILQWSERDDMPNKMAAALHTRTMLFLREHGRVRHDGNKMKVVLR